MRRSLLLLVLLMGVAAWAQDETKEMRTLKPQLREAELARTQADTWLKRAEASYRESQALFDKGLISKTELAEAEETYNRARLELEQTTIALEKTRLAFLNDALHVTLEKAALYRDKDGRKHALFRLRNNSNLRKIVDEEGNYSDDEKRGLLAIENLRVRIFKDGCLIGRPFEYRIAHLPYHRSREVDFVLQRETEDVVLHVAYGDTTITLPVYLEREAKEDRVLIEAVQFSQEAELGTRVTYELEAERFVDDDKAFTLSVLNLPSDYTYEFRERDRENGREESRVSRVRFKKGVTTKGLELILSMPKEIAKSDLNSKIAFFVLMLDRFSQQRLAELKSLAQGRSLADGDLDSAGISYETLELIPRGRAEIDITAGNFFTKVKMGEVIDYSFTLHNSGTVNLDRVQVELGLPLDWSASMSPEKNIDLDVGSKQKVDVEIIPAVDVVAGDYEVTLNAATLHEGSGVEATPKIMRIQIEGKSNFVVGAILMLVLVGMIVGVAVMTIKVSRR
jgi:hypothetical protein